MELRLGLAYLSEEVKIKDTDTVNSIVGFSPLYAGIKYILLKRRAGYPKLRFSEGW